MHEGDFEAACETGAEHAPYWVAEGVCEEFYAGADGRGFVDGLVALGELDDGCCYGDAG